MVVIRLIPKKACIREKYTKNIKKYVQKSTLNFLAHLAFEALQNSVNNSKAIQGFFDVV